MQAMCVTLSLCDVMCGLAAWQDLWGTSHDWSVSNRTVGSYIPTRQQPLSWGDLPGSCVAAKSHFLARMLVALRMQSTNRSVCVRAAVPCWSSQPCRLVETMSRQAPMASPTLLRLIP
eukprot:6306718-Amphidinium_carterae.1